MQDECQMRKTTQQEAPLRKEKISDPCSGAEKVCQRDEKGHFKEQLQEGLQLVMGEPGQGKL